MNNPAKEQDSQQQNVIKILPDQGTTREIFRAQRSANTNTDIKLKLAGKFYDILNWSRTGLAFEAPFDKNPVKPNQLVSEIEIHCGDIVVYKGALEVKSVRPSQQDKHFSSVGCEFKQQLFPVVGLQSALAVKEIASKVEGNYQELREVNPDICKVIVEFSSALQMMRKTCEDEEKRLAELTYDERHEAEKIFLAEMSKLAKRTFNEMSRRVATIIDVEVIPENSVYHRLFEENIYPYFQGADLVRRAFEKPRGYAGDFEMMNAIYRNGYEGNGLFGKVLHNYVTIEDQSETVLFRKPYFIGHMEKALATQGPKNILSIASGPAVEIQEVVRKWNQDLLSRTAFTLFDLDRMALEHAQTKIYQAALDTQKQVNTEFLNASVKAFLKHNATSKTEYDLIYSGGLFDYLDNLTAQGITHSLFKLLKPGGRLVIGNLTKENTTKAFCHLITRWHLIHKTEREMRAWADDLPDTAISFDYDPNHIQAFIVIVKTR